MKCRHYFLFEKKYQEELAGKKLTRSGWDYLRVSDNTGPFGIEDDIEAYERNCKNATSHCRAAHLILQELRDLNCTRIVSLGVGKGILEWNIKKLCPDICVECTDYAAESIEKLKAVFTNADRIEQFDMRTDDYRSFGLENDCRNGTMVLFRLSTEFSKDEWMNIFMRMKEARVPRILFIPTGLDDLKSMIAEQYYHWIRKLKGLNDTCCGWLFSRREFVDMWQGLYRIKTETQFDNTAAFVLELIDE